MLGAETTTINPPTGYATGWWLVAGGVLLALAALAWWARRSLRRSRTSHAGSALARLRAQTVAELDAARAGADEGPVEVERQRAAVTAMLAAVRRFVGTATDGDTDYETHTQVRRAAAKDPRLDHVVVLLDEFSPILFDGRTSIDVAAAHQRCREVVQAWT